MEITTDKGDTNQDKPVQNQGDEYEFMIPLSATTKLRPFVDRYFVKYYKRFPCSHDSQLTCNQYAYLHTNKLFMIGIAKEHAIITQNLAVSKISFQCITKGDNLQVKGKKKSINFKKCITELEGGMKVHPGTKVCEISTENGLVFEFFSQVSGYIIEFNENLEKDLKYLTNYPESKGFIAIINSGLDVDKITKTLVTEEDYKAGAEKIQTE